MFKYGYHQNILMDGDHDTPEYVRFFFLYSNVDQGKICHYLLLMGIF